VSVTENERKSVAKINWQEPTLCMDECGKTVFAAWDQNMRLLLPDEPCFLAQLSFKIPVSVRRVTMLEKDTELWEHLLRKSKLSPDSPWLQHVSKEEFGTWIRNISVLKSQSKSAEPVRAMTFPSTESIGDQVDAVYEDDSGNVTVAWTVDGQPIVVLPFLNLTVAGIRSQMRPFMFLQNAALSKGYLSELADKAKQIPVSLSEVDESDAVVVSGEERDIVLLRSAKWVTEAIQRYLNTPMDEPVVKGALSCSNMRGGEWQNGKCVRQCPTGKFFLPSENKCVSGTDPKLLDYWEELAKNNADIKTLKGNGQGLRVFIGQVIDLKTALGPTHPDVPFLDAFVQTLGTLKISLDDMKYWLQLYGEMESKGALNADEVKLLRLQLATLLVQIKQSDEYANLQLDELRSLAGQDPHKIALIAEVDKVVDSTAIARVEEDFKAKMKTIDVIDTQVSNDNISKVRVAASEVLKLFQEVVDSATDLTEATEEGDRDAAQANLSQLRSKFEAFNAQVQDAYKAAAGLEAQVAPEISTIASQRAIANDAVSKALTAVESANWEMEKDILINSCKATGGPLITTVHLNSSGLVDLVWNECGDYIVPKDDITPQQQIPAIMVYQGSEDNRMNIIVRNARFNTKIGEGTGDATSPMLAKTATVQKELNTSIEFYSSYQGDCEALPGSAVVDGVCKRLCAPGEDYVMGQCFARPAPEYTPQCGTDEELTLTPNGWQCMPVAPLAPSLGPEAPLATSLRLSTPAAPLAPSLGPETPFATSLRLSTPAAPLAPSRGPITASFVPEAPLAPSRGPETPFATSLRLSTPAAPLAPSRGPITASFVPEAPLASSRGPETPFATSLRLSRPAAPLAPPLVVSRVSSGVQAPPTLTISSGAPPTLVTSRIRAPTAPNAQFCEPPNELVVRPGGRLSCQPPAS